MKKINTNDKYSYIIVCLLALLVMPVYYFGVRVLIITAVALFTAVFIDLVFTKLFHFTRESKDFSSIITALIIVLLMPATVSYTVVAIAVFIALGIAKFPFGGAKNNIFNPAGVGMAVSVLSFPVQTLTFPVTGQNLPLQNEIYQSADIIFKNSPASVMNVGGTPSIDHLSLLLGDYTGAMGATCILILGIILLFLCFTKIISFNIVLGGLLTVVSYAVLFPRINTGIKDSIIYELCSGILLFGFIFMASDPTTAPKTKTGRFLYGVILALITMIFRSVGALNVEFVFVLLILNATSKEFDRLPISIKRKFQTRKRQIHKHSHNSVRKEMAK